MNPSTLIPSLEPIPVHWGWLSFFHLFTFSLHLLFMNIMLGGSLIALFSAGKGHKEEAAAAAAEAKRDGYRKLPFLMAFTINTGVAPLLFIQVLYGHLIYSSSILMGGYWLSVAGILIAAYYCAYLTKDRFDALKAFRPMLGGLIALLLLWVAFVFTNNMTLMQNPRAWLSYFDNDAGTLLNLSDPILLPRFFHFVTASVALAGLFKAVVWSVGQKKNAPGAGRNRVAGLRLYAFANGIQLAVGIWFVIKLPGQVRGLVLGENPYCTGLLLLGLAGGLGGIGSALKERLWPTVGSTLIAVSAMVGLRDLIRRAYLEPYFKLSAIPVQAQYWPMVVFLIVLLLGIAVVVHMLRLAGRAVGGR